MRFRIRAATAGAAGVLMAVAVVGGAPAAAAADSGPTIFRGGAQETIPDDFLLDLCGIEADVTVTERWTVKKWPDGSWTLQSVRTYVSSDPRIPTEKGAATSFNSPDGSRIVVGKPAQLFEPDGGVRLVASGWILIDPDDVTVASHGRDVYRDADQEELYCP